jgi:hypothetical protein
VQINLRVDDVAENMPSISYHRDRGFVAAGLDGQG